MAMGNVDKLEKFLASFEKKAIPLLESLDYTAKKVNKNTPQIRNSWSGSWIGYHHKLYYCNFEKPPMDEKFSVEWGGVNGFSDRWQKRDPEEVRNYLEKISGVSIDEMEREYKSLIHIVDDFYDETSIIIKTDKEMQEEITKEKLLDGHKKLTQGEEGKLYLKGQMPATLMTRDSEAMTEGVFTPSILYYEGLTHEIIKCVELVYKNIKSIYYFIRWMKEKYSSEKKETVQSSPTSLYVREEIIEAIKNKKDGFNYTKLIKLITELNKNYLDSNPYSCLALIRAITDHIPPLTGYSSFEEVVNNYKGAKTNKNFIVKLFNNRGVSDDSLHTSISNANDLIDMDNVPNQLLLNRLLQECLDSTVAEGFKHPKMQKQPNQDKKTQSTTDPNLRPILRAEITSVSGGPNGYFAEFDIRNVGKGLALLDKVQLGDLIVPVRESTLSENEKCK